MTTITVEKLESISDDDMVDLCDAAETAIVDGGGFGWIKPPPRAVMERFWKGALLIPERSLFVGRIDGRIAGSAQLIRPPRNNEAQSFGTTLTTSFVAPWARGHGLARRLTQAVEDEARKDGFYFLNLDVRESQQAAIKLYESLGFKRWGTNPNYAMVDGKIIVGLFYSKQLRQVPRRARAAFNTEAEPAR